MVYTTSGEIIRHEYDKFVDVEKISFRDEKLRTENYLELPRSVISFEEGESIKLEITQDEKKVDMKKKPKMVMNTTLYMIRPSKANEEEHIFQFSTGGLIFRIITRDNQIFKLRGNRKFKLVLY